MNIFKNESVVEEEKKLQKIFPGLKITGVIGNPPEAVEISFYQRGTASMRKELEKAGWEKVYRRKEEFGYWITMQKKIGRRD